MDKKVTNQSRKWNKKDWDWGIANAGNPIDMYIYTYLGIANIFLDAETNTSFFRFIYNGVWYQRTIPLYLSKLQAKVKVIEFMEEILGKKSEDI